MHKTYIYILLAVSSLLFLGGCSTGKELLNYDLEKPVDTSSREIDYQKKKTYELYSLGVFADNEFDGARLNDFTSTSGDTCVATITPENTPINRSPWYSFRIWSKRDRQITLALNYRDVQHRYYPKISTDGETWFDLDTTLFNLSTDQSTAYLTLSLTDKKLWVSAQELQNTGHVNAWCREKSKISGVTLSDIGHSIQGRNIPALDVNLGKKDNKDIIVILGRQHPPEVTGHLALKAFIDELLNDSVLSKAFRKKYRILVIPLINPDGVDLGHWRHNTGGIDLNRDWAYYRQPEVKQVAQYIVDQCNEYNSNVILGIDFHSTYRDVYYTLKNATPTLNGFKDIWLHGISSSLRGYDTNDRPGETKSPVSKTWFYKQFKAEAITYEIGDETPRDVILLKGKTAAIEMMQLLVLR